MNLLLALAVAVLGVLLYLRLPVDLLPDRLGPLGLLDDLIVAAAAVWWLRRRARPRAESGDRADGSWNPWAVLGVPRGASREEITRAYREQLKRYHPDRVASLGEELQRVAHRRTLEIQRAYRELAGA